VSWTLLRFRQEVKQSRPKSRNRPSEVLLHISGNAT
jgi:hypothetical protein